MDAINNPHDGLLLKLDKARRKADVLAQSRVEQEEASSEKQVVTDDDLRDIFRVLTKQSQGIKVL